MDENPYSPPKSHEKRPWKLSASFILNCFVVAALLIIVLAQYLPDVDTPRSEAARKMSEHEAQLQETSESPEVQVSGP